MSPETVTVKPYFFASGEGLADVWWKTGRHTVKAGHDETGNAFSQFEIDDPLGSGPPLHVHHNEDETFYVLKGEITMFVGDERIDLEAGDYCFGPRASPRLPRALRACTDARDDQPLGLRAALRLPRRPRHERRAPGVTVRAPTRSLRLCGTYSRVSISGKKGRRYVDHAQGNRRERYPSWN